MSDSSSRSKMVPIDTSVPVWDQFFTVAPLVLIGTRDADGSLNLAPKHMVLPMGWQNYFGFVCTPRHKTCRNVARSGEFTVSYPRPSQVLTASLAASPRDTEGAKPIVDLLPTRPAGDVDACYVEDAYLYFACRHFRTIDGFGENCLVTGEIIAAYADDEFLRHSQADDQETIHDAPLLAFLPPGRFATIDRSNAFPFPEAMQR